MENRDMIRALCRISESINKAADRNGRIDEIVRRLDEMNERIALIEQRLAIMDIDGDGKHD